MSDDSGARPAIAVDRLPHEHRLSCDGLVSLAFSRSYMPALNGDAGQLARRRVEAVFAEYAHRGCVVVRYRCVAFMFQPLG